MPEQSIKVTGAQITSTAEKLQKFSKDLAPGEKAVIDWLMQRAASAPHQDAKHVDVPAFVSTSELHATGLHGDASAHLARAIGLSGPTAGITVTVRVRF